MKKTLGLGLALVCALTTVGCGSGESADSTPPAAESGKSNSSAQIDQMNQANGPATDIKANAPALK